MNVTSVDVRSRPGWPEELQWVTSIWPRLPSGEEASQITCRKSVAESKDFL